MNSIARRPSSVVHVSLYFLLAAFVVAFYLVIAYLQNGEFGFPLDDAWIHQVYARNLGTRFEFSFFAGQPSAGSTSPLWAILLGIGYFLRIDFRVWTILLGIFFLGASAWMTQRVTKHLTDGAMYTSPRVANWIAPLLILLEWHLVWAAASGMEILLFVFLALALVESFFAKRNAWLVGALAGLLTLTRPEGIVLAGLIGFGLLLRAVRDPKGFTRARDTIRARVENPLGLDESRAVQDPKGFTRARDMVRARVENPLGLWAWAIAVFAFTFTLVLVPYLFFNLQTSGTLLPNTFYAKASEYAQLTTNTNFFARWLLMFRQPLIGAQLLLIPGLLYAMVFFARKRDWTRLLPALWIVLLPALYAWRLPVEYQFGRYMMPIIPFVMIYGVVGTAMLFQKIKLRLLRRAWGMTVAVLLIIFLFLGANLYAQAVAIINCEMVAVAKWTRANVPHGELIAAHDIGAQGYFDPRPMLDLAGLVSPEVIPFIREETKLKAWMIARGARYAIFFPTWYPKLATDAQLLEVFSTGCAVTRGMGEENLRVYLSE